MLTQIVLTFVITEMLQFYLIDTSKSNSCHSVRFMYVVICIHDCGAILLCMWLPYSYTII